MARPTTSAIGRRANESLRRAFTLVEVLIVIALLGAVTAVVITDFSTLVDGARTPTAYECVRDAVEAGRAASRDSGDPVHVAWIADTHTLRVVAGEKTRDFEVPGADSVGFVFPDDDDGSEKPLDALVFHPSGAALPAIVIIRMNGVESRYRMEIFSAALSPVEP